MSSEHTESESPLHNLDGSSGRTKRLVLTRFLKKKSLVTDALDVLSIQERMNESTRDFQDYLKEKEYNREFGNGILIASTAENEIDSLPKKFTKRVIGEITKLRDSDYQQRSVKMTGLDEYRLRVGDYRILFAISPDTSNITILSVCRPRKGYR